MRLWKKLSINLTNNLFFGWKPGLLNHFSIKKIIYSFVFLILMMIPIRLSSDCTPGRYGFRGYSFLNPYIIDQAVPSAPLFIDIQAIYDAFGGQEIVQENENLAEWRDRYCNRATVEDIRAVVYDSNWEELSALRDDITYDSPAISSDFEDNTFARYLKRNECLETIDYLMFTKKCEPHVTLGSDPWKTPKRDLVIMQKLIDQGIEAFKKTESHYIRLRYAYQIIRLAHYRKDYPNVLSLYDYLMPQVDNDASIIEDWIEGHRAGALLSLGRNVEASYIFSKIFENCPSKSESAFQSFTIRTDEEWEACLQLCQRDRERATLYVLRAQAADSKALQEMEKIYILDPENRHLEVLLVREIRKLEKDLLGSGFNSQRDHNRRLGFPRSFAGTYVIDMRRFLTQIVKEKKVKRPAFWQVALGYVETLAGNYYDANKTFEAAAALPQVKKDRMLNEQLRVFQLALKISAYLSATEEVETEVNQIRKDPLYKKYRDFNDFLRDKMAFLYKQGASPGKAFLSANRFQDLQVNPQLAVIDDLLAICRKPSRNSLETALITKAGGETIENDLIDLKGTLLFSEFRLDESLKVFKEMDRNLWDNYGVFNPFIDRLKDCVKCVLPDTANNYSKGDLLERLVNLETLARAEPENAALYYYELGTAFYNMSYYSYAWQIMDPFRSGVSMNTNVLRRAKDNVVPHPNYPMGNKENFDCARALFYFERARATTQDAELAARATYAAAKCERNTWYINRLRGAKHEYANFKILREQYADTKYYKRVIRECKTFAIYASK